MKFLKIYEAWYKKYFKYKHELTEEEFQKVFNYFCFDVFNESKVELINQIIIDSIDEVEFMDFYDRTNQRRSVFELSLFPYFGLKMSKNAGTYMGMSYEFQKEINNKTYNLENCKSCK